MFRKAPSDGSFFVLVSYIVLAFLIGLSLWKLDQLMAVIANLLFS